MKLSQLFLKTQKEFPKDETALNAKLLIKGNFIDKLMAGVFSILPLGFRITSKIKNIIREELNALGAEEVFLPALHPRSSWDVTGRWQVMSEIMYQFKDHSGRELGLGPTHEEIVSAVAAKVINSYKDLPRFIYQIQTKFRDEARAKSGLLRSREFTMKDLYSFHADVDSLNEFYEKAKEAYLKIFKRCGLDAILTEASGGAFSKYSHEFMVAADVGEDEINFCSSCRWAQNLEIAEDKTSKCPNCGDVIKRIKAIEVGNIFKLGTKFSEPVGLLYKDSDGESKPVIMGSYGIGIERLMGTIVETHNDENGIIWPESVAPFAVQLVCLGEAKKLADKVYDDLIKAGIEVLYDDREGLSAGEKLKDADLLGMPWRFVVSEKTGSGVEAKKRSEKTAKVLSVKEAIKLLKNEN